MPSRGGGQRQSLGVLFSPRPTLWLLSEGTSSKSHPWNVPRRAVLVTSPPWDHGSPQFLPKQ